MSQIIEFKQNQRANSKRRNFQGKFPDKAAVEAQIVAAIDSAATLAQLKTVLKRVLNGDANTSGLVDALFELDR